MYCDIQVRAFGSFEALLIRFFPKLNTKSQCRVLLSLTQRAWFSMLGAVDRYKAEAFRSQDCAHRRDDK